MRSAHWSIAQLLRMSAGLIIWSSGFVVLYAGFSLGCQHLDVPVEAGLINPVTFGLLAAFALHALALVSLLWLWHHRPVRAAEGESERSRRLRHRVEGMVLWVSLAGLVFFAFPVLMVPPCAP